MPDIINTGPNPRFVGGRLIPVGEPYNPEEAAGSEAFVTGTTPAGQLSVEQLEALLARKKGQATDDVTQKREREGLAAPTSPTADGPLRPVSDEHVHEPSVLDRDGDGAAGGSRKKAEIASDLTAAGVKFDSALSRDELAKLLADHNKA
jgi:hypothetical protein